MTVEQAEEIIWEAYSDDTPPDALTGEEWRRLERLNNAIDGNPPEQSMTADDAAFLEQCAVKVDEAQKTAA